MDNSKLTYDSTDTRDANYDPELAEIAQRFKGMPASLQAAITRLELSRMSQSETGYPDELISAPELASRFGVPINRLRGRLETFRASNDAGYKEVENPRRNEPRYLYRLGFVQHICESLKQKICAEPAPKK
jgi:hypothetical protein